MISLKELEVQPGQRITRKFLDTLWRKLLRAIEERTLKGGTGVRLRRGPDGINVSAKRGGRSGGSLLSPWRVRLGQDESSRTIVTFSQRGTVNGFEARVGDDALMSDTDPQTDEPVPFVVEADRFDAQGVCRLYAAVELDPASWAVKVQEGGKAGVSIVASEKVPPAKAAFAYKLIALLLQETQGGKPVPDGSIALEQHLFHNLSLVAVNRRSNGSFTPLWGAA